jgi:TPR repeat protein
MAARGRADLSCVEEAHEWLAKGKELHAAAFNDPGWLSMMEAKSRFHAGTDRHAQLRTILEFMRLVSEGADPETTSVFLDMSPEDREMASTMRSYWPDTSASLVRHAQKEREREQANLLRHEERLRRAFVCFQTGYSLDPYNRELNFILSEYYSMGLGVERDEAASLSHLRRAAALGHAGAQHALGYRYSTSMRSGRGQEAASTWLPRAPENTAGNHWAGHSAYSAVS